eukprot:CAMPEP_0171051162 /NCGR_PEP_ID=MMETSP0736-20130129/52881_1 /TAXON_ID=186038 /ORGANISM="Fragilariopsis kerguelensis, Strain L26-C5" /LENGTH=38 /DNA_ID= /DNA_START= /DNA_END= /DNA_ORIENTATION=
MCGAMKGISPKESYFSNSVTSRFLLLLDDADDERNEDK